MSKADVKAATENISAKYKADQAACAAMTANAKDICSEEAKGRQKIATAELVATGFSIVGSATYNADKTYATEGTFTLGLKLTLPLSCFAPGKNCAGLQAVYVQQGMFDMPTCSVQGLACVCSLVSTQDTTDSGTYSTSGTTNV
jgi:hypothetical protein